MLRRHVLVLVAAVVSTACSTAAIGVSQPSQPPNVDFVQVDYRNPILNGVSMPSAAAAAAAVSAFRVVPPKGISGVTNIFATPPGTPADAQLAAFVIQSETYGLVGVVEGVPQQPTVAEYNNANEELIKLNGEPYTHGKIISVSIRGGEEGFLSTSEDGRLKHRVLYGIGDRVRSRGTDVDVGSSH